MDRRYKQAHNIVLQDRPWDTGRPQESTGALILFGVLMVSSFYWLDVGGRLYASEIILAGYAFHLLATSPSQPLPIPKWIPVTLVLWGVGSVFSDFVAESPLLTLVRGILRIGFTITDFVALYVILSRDRRLIPVALTGLVAAAFLAVYVQPSVFVQESPWKFALGVPITVLAALVASVKNWRLPGLSLMFLGLAGVHFFMGFRSMAAITLIALLILALRSPAGPRAKPPSKLRIPLLVVAGTATVVLLVSMYDDLALSGSLGYSAQQKASYQAGGDYGSLLSSRSEVFLSAGTIARLPLFGGGSFSMAAPEVSRWAANLLNDHGYPQVADNLLENPITYHSALLAAWAENGILAVPFWLGVAAVFIKGLAGVVLRTCAAPPLVTVMSLTGLWNLLFSPFGADSRIWLTLSLATVIILVGKENTHAESFNSHH